MVEGRTAPVAVSPALQPRPGEGRTGLPVDPLGAPAATVTAAAGLAIVGTRKRFLSGPGVTYHESPNQGDRFVAPYPDITLLHYTASGTTAGAVATLCDPRPDDPRRRVSAHVLVGRDGQIVQLVPFDTVAWHAGESTWQGHPWVNARAIGIEQVNWGVLERGPAGWVSWTGARVPDDQVVVIGGIGWHRYTDAQIATCIALCHLLRTAYPIRLILGHEQVAPGRKHDPGPAFPFERVRSEVGLEVVA